MNKLIFTLLFITFFSGLAFSQVNPAFKYQGVARNASNAPLTNQNINLRFQILNASGSPVYSETQATRTSDLGIFSVNVCQGTNVSGTCGAIDWSAGQFNLKVEMDATGGTSFVNIGNSPILMAPIAAYALKAGGGTVDNDGNPTNELQDLSFNDATGSLSISQRNSVNLGALKDDADADPLNEIQTISIDTSDNSIILSKNGGRVQVAGASTVWKKSGDSLTYNHTNAIGLTFKPTRFEIKFGPEVWRRMTSVTNRWTDELRTFPSNARGIEVATGFDIVEYPVTFARQFIRFNRDTFFRVNTYNYLFQPGASPGAITQLDLYSQANNNGQPLSLIATRIEGSGGLGNYHAYLGGRIGATTGNLNINNVFTPFTGIWAPNGSNIFGLFFNAAGQAQFAANIKNFVEEHPKDATKQIWYACVEGPEAAAYQRGTTQLVNGYAEVNFPEHFELTINPATMTVQLSPNSADSEGLAVIEKTATGFKVKELRKGTGNYSFDWEVKAVRKGYENYQPVREKLKVKLPGTETVSTGIPVVDDQKK